MEGNGQSDLDWIRWLVKCVLMMWFFFPLTRLKKIKTNEAVDDKDKEDENVDDQTKPNIVRWKAGRVRVGFGWCCARLLWGLARSVDWADLGRNVNDVVVEDVDVGDQLEKADIGLLLSVSRCAHAVITILGYNGEAAEQQRYQENGRSTAEGEECARRALRLAATWQPGHNEWSTTIKAVCACTAGFSAGWR